MSIDEQLRRAFDTLSDHLRNELTRQLDTIKDELAEAASRQRDEALSAAHSDRDRALAAAQAEHEAALEATRTEHENALDAARRQHDEALAAASTDREQAIAAAAAEAADRARAQGRAEADADAEARIAAAAAEAEERGREQVVAEAERRIAELERQLHATEQQARAAQEQSRIAIEQAAEAARADAQTGEAAAVERVLTDIRSIDAARSLSAILDALLRSAAADTARAAVLLVRGDRLRAWRFAGFDGRTDLSPSFEIAKGDARIVGEAADRGQPVRGDAQSAPAFARLTQGRNAVAVPLSMGGEVVAVLYADEGEGPAASSGRFAERVELVARHAGSVLEAMTAFMAARALVQHPRGQADAAAADADESARRYARLLVSEIKLYHEADVLAGRRERDLASRLAGEIERARKLYEEHVPASARAAADYFHSELVRTLASGDPSLLGN